MTAPRNLPEHVQRSRPSGVRPGRTLRRPALLRLVVGPGFQGFVVVLAWVWLCALHWHNDGLWYQGDSPRHALNGVFWADLIRRGWSDPQGFALAYYARYPSINPTSYPPVFYLAEAVAYGVFGISPFVAKGLVLVFALVAALYTTAWLRRWVARGAGLAGALVPLLPGVVCWSHSVMLNVPAFALTLGSLYHTRRWLDAPRSRQVYPAAGLGVLAILCYFPSAVLLIVGLGWLIALGQWRLLTRTRTLAVALGSALMLVPSFLISLHWAPMHVEMTRPAPQKLLRLANWTYYLHAAPELFGWTVIVLAACGAAASLVRRRWRGEAMLMGFTILIIYGFYSLLKAKEGRYALLLAVPLVDLTAIGLATFARGATHALLRRPRAGLVLGPSLALLLALQGWRAGQVAVPSLAGHRALVAYLERVAPHEPCLYDGKCDGVFIYYVRAVDWGFRRQVVRGDKLLYVLPLNGSLRPREYVTSTEQVREAIRNRSGCRWLAVEVGPETTPVPAARLLREALNSPGFEKVQTFPLSGAKADRIELYRARFPVEPVPDLEIPFQLLGPDVRLRLKPIS